MTKLGRIILAAMALVAPATGHAVLFDFENAPVHTSLPIDLTVDGITAHFSATGQGFSIQPANTMGFTPAGFSGLCVYPNSVFPADLIVEFTNATLTDFSIMFAPEEYGCDTSALMRVTAYMNGAYVGTSTATAYPPGTWPTGTLSFSSPQGFNKVVVHYDTPPPCGDYGPIFMADNMIVTRLATASAGAETMAAALTPVIAPNPFANETVIRLGLARTAMVSVSIYDGQGRLVRTLLAGTLLGPDVRSIRWDGRDDGGHEVSSGVYLCRAESDGKAAATRMLLLRGR